jgi:cytochrome c oxidase subunit III
MDRARLASGRTAMLVFVASDAFAFAGLLFVYAYLQVVAGGAGAEVTPPVAVGLGLTAVLLLSSGTLWAAARARGARQRGLLWATAALGALFCAGQALEWSHLAGAGFLLGGSHRAGAFYVITGYHGLHVAAGAVALAVLAIRARRRPPGAELEVAAVYWHFVDVVWLFLFVALYVI